MNQAIIQMDQNLSFAENAITEQLPKIKSLEAQVIRLEAENESLKEFQEQRNVEVVELQAVRGRLA